MAGAVVADAHDHQRLGIVAAQEQRIIIGKPALKRRKALHVNVGLEPAACCAGQRHALGMTAGSTVQLHDLALGAVALPA